MEAKSHGLSAAVRTFAAHAWEAFALRGELLAIEIAQERRRLLFLIGCTLATAFGIYLSLLFASLLVVAIFWETHPYWALGSVAIFHATLAAVTGWMISRSLRRHALAFEDSINVMKEDCRCLCGDQTN